MATYDRYSQFRINGIIKMVPFGEIPKKSTDYYVIYERGKTRLDRLSSDYYGNPDYAWLILQANPEAGMLEFEIPDKTELRIPFPLQESINDYRESIEEYNEFYGI